MLQIKIPQYIYILCGLDSHHTVFIVYIHAYIGFRKLWWNDFGNSIFWNNLEIIEHLHIYVTTWRPSNKQQYIVVTYTILILSSQHRINLRLKTPSITWARTWTYKSFRGYVCSRICYDYISGKVTSIYHFYLRHPLVRDAAIFPLILNNKAKSKEQNDSIIMSKFEQNTYG